MSSEQNNAYLADFNGDGLLDSLEITQSGSLPHILTFRVVLREADGLFTGDVRLHDHEIILRWIGLRLCSPRLWLARARPL